jgi:Lamin Tail Domain
MKIIAIIGVFLFGFPTKVWAPPPPPPPVIVSEIMINPTVGKSKGTWFEFYNPGNKTYNLTGLYLYLINYNATAPVVQGVANIEFRAFQLPLGSVIPPKQYYVIGNRTGYMTLL